MLELVGCGFSGGGLRMDGACLSIEYGRQIQKYGASRKGGARTIVCKYVVQSDTMSGRLSEKFRLSRRNLRNE